MARTVKHWRGLPGWPADAVGLVGATFAGWSRRGLSAGLGSPPAFRASDPCRRRPVVAPRDATSWGSHTGLPRRAAQERLADGSPPGSLPTLRSPAASTDRSTDGAACNVARRVAAGLTRSGHGVVGGEARRTGPAGDRPGRGKPDLPRSDSGIGTAFETGAGASSQPAEVAGLARTGVRRRHLVPAPERPAVRAPCLKVVGVGRKACTCDRWTPCAVSAPPSTPTSPDPARRPRDASKDGRGDQERLTAGERFAQPSRSGLRSSTIERAYHSYTN